MSFEAHPRSILHLFRNPENLIYKIPMYQRSYSWKEEDVQAFCEDLLKVVENDTKDYFWGAIINIKENENIYEIVDGQQRITTFTILIAKLKNLCSQILEKVKKEQILNPMLKFSYEDIESQLTEKISDLNQCMTYKNNNKLTLSEVDEEFFKKMINLSNEVRVIAQCKLIIDEIEKKDSIVTDPTKKSSYKKDIKKDIFKIDSLDKDLQYEDFKYCYMSKYPQEDQYTYNKTDKYLIIQYLKLRLGSKSIRDYINDEKIISNDDQRNIVDLLKSIDTKVDIESHKNLIKSWEIIDDLIIKLMVNIEDLETQSKEVINFVEKFINDTYVVSIKANSQENAYMMFQVLNDRGRSLGIVELLRPYTLQRVKSNEMYKDEVSNCWDEISKDKNCESYLKDYLASYINVSPREKKLHNKYKNTFFKETDSEVDIYNNVKKIKDMKVVYDKLVEGIWPYDGSSKDLWYKNRLNQIIKVLEYDRTIPLLMCIKDIGTEDDFIKVIDIIERVVFRYVTICEKRPGKVTKLYSEIIEESRANGSFLIAEFRKKMKDLLNEDGCDEDTFKSKIDSGKLKYSNNSKANKKIKYFLSTIEYYYKEFKDNPSKEALDSPSRTKVLNDKIIEIEHIYAQNIDSAHEDEYLESVKHNIGNLVLLEKSANIKESNKPFDEKKDGYNSEDINITKELNDISEWNEDEYKKRLKKYQQIASKIFLLN